MRSQWLESAGQGLAVLGFTPQLQDNERKISSEKHARIRLPVIFLCCAKLHTVDGGGTENSAADLCYIIVSSQVRMLIRHSNMSTFSAYPSAPQTPVFIWVPVYLQEYPTMAYLSSSPAWLTPNPLPYAPYQATQAAVEKSHRHTLEPTQPRAGQPYSHSPAPPAPLPKLSAASRLPLVDLSSIDTLIAFPPRPGAHPRLRWNVNDDPERALAEAGIARTELERCAVRTNGEPLARLTLVFPSLRLQLPVLPSRRSLGYATLWDVLLALHRGLLEPARAHELAVLGANVHAELLQAANAAGNGTGLNYPRRVELLGEKKWFLGIRPAMPWEVPGGTRIGEVFVVEVGMKV